jgi:hypothetical protein
MLIFYSGEWKDVKLPEYTDPSWSFFQQMQAAYLILKGLEWSEIERLVY